MSPRALALAALLAGAFSGQSWAEEATVTWYDPSCRFFVAQLPEGFGLYELKSGPEPKVGDVMEGAILGGPRSAQTTRLPISLSLWSTGATQGTPTCSSATRPGGAKANASAIDNSPRPQLARA